MQIAGIDFGRKRIGLAISDGQGAYPIGVMERRSLKYDLDAIRSRLVDREVSLIVVGLPLNMDGTEGPSARAARAFAEHVGSATGLPVEMFDERLTSCRGRGAPARGVGLADIEKGCAEKGRARRRGRGGNSGRMAGKPPAAAESAMNSASRPDEACATP